MRVRTRRIVAEEKRFPNILNVISHRGHHDRQPVQTATDFITAVYGAKMLRQCLDEFQAPSVALAGKRRSVVRLPMLSFAIEAMKSPDLRVIEVLAKCLKAGETIYCMIERAAQPTYCILMVDINRDEAGCWDVLLYQD